MDNLNAPLPAVSGVKDADKIRVVIYANNGLAHMPLSEILKFAAGQNKQPDKQAADKTNKPQ